MSAPLSGHAALSGTAQQLDPNETTASCIAFTIRAPLTNAAAAFIGPAGITSSTGHQMDPGDEIVYQRQSQAGANFYQNKVSDFYVLGTGGDVITWLALV